MIEVLVLRGFSRVVGVVKEGKLISVDDLDESHYLRSVTDNWYKCKPLSKMLFKKAENDFPDMVQEWKKGLPESERAELFDE